MIPSLDSFSLPTEIPSNRNPETKYHPHFNSKTGRWECDCKADPNIICTHAKDLMLIIKDKVIEIQSTRLNKPLNELALTFDETYDMMHDTPATDLITATACILLQENAEISPDMVHEIIGDFPNKDGRTYNAAYGIAFKEMRRKGIIEWIGESKATRDQRHGNRAGIYRRGINFGGN